MKLKFFLILLITFFGFAPGVFARVSVNDTYQAKQSQFEDSVNGLSDPGKKQKILEFNQMLKDVNLKVTSRFDDDMAKMAAILEEFKRRKNVTETTVAYGQGDTPLDSGAYWVNWAQEAVAYQKIQDYTPYFSGNNVSGAARNSISRLSSDLGTVKNKVLTAKTYVQKAVSYAE
ncbi:MAG: hypothetical protein Q7R49_02825 [Candidatus Daviesbacteria bacterium]|nr:hypothetical protein [Candidatus Daviesbacteria bacterium]